VILQVDRVCQREGKDVSGGSGRGSTAWHEAKRAQNWLRHNVGWMRGQKPWLAGRSWARRSARRRTGPLGGRRMAGARDEDGRPGGSTHALESNWKQSRKMGSAAYRLG